MNPIVINQSIGTPLDRQIQIPTSRRHNSKQNVPLAAMAISRPNSRQQNYQSIPKPMMHSTSNELNSRKKIQIAFNHNNKQQQMTRASKDNQFQNLNKRNEIESNQDFNDETGDLDNDEKNERSMVSYVIDHFRTSSNNEQIDRPSAGFYQQYDGYNSPNRLPNEHEDYDEGFEVETVHDNEVPVPKPRQSQLQSQHFNRLSLKYELGSSSVVNESINLRMRRNNSNQPITPRTGPVTSSTMRKVI